MKDDTNGLSRRRLLGGAATIGGAAALGGTGTMAFFSDEETFANNQLVAGELDMKVGYSAHYSDWSADEDGSDTSTTDDDVDVVMWDGAPTTTGGPGDLPQGYTGLPTNAAWLIAVDDPDQFLTNTQYASNGTASCGPDGTDGDDLEQPVISIEDVKPGDFGEVTFDFALCDNPGYVWLQGELLSCAENGVSEPEAKDDDENEDQPRSADSDQSSLWPLAALAGVPALGGDDGDGGAGGTESEIEADAVDAEDGTAERESSDRRSTLRKGAAAAGAGAAGVSAVSGTASAEKKDKKGGPDPDGPNDVNIGPNNANLEVNVGELNSGGGLSGSSDWIFEGQTTLYRETYGFRDGTSATHQNAEQDATVVSTFPSSASPGTQVGSTVEFSNFANANGDSTPLEVDRNVTLRQNEARLDVEYEITNTGSANINDLRITQYVDYDIEDIGDDFGRYFNDPQAGCEYIWLKDVSEGLFAGFTSQQSSSNHSLTEYNDGLDSAGLTGFFEPDLEYNNNDRYPPSSGTADTELTFEWSLGSLSGGETTTYTNSFVYNTNEQEFRNELCQAGGGDPTPTPCADVELLDVVQAAAWVDDGDNYQDGDEAPAIVGSLRDVLTQLSSDTGLALAGDTPAEEGGGTGRNCFSAEAIHSVAFAWWVPVDHGNEIQTDSASFDLGFYTEQCRHNDGSGMEMGNSDS